jgi:hypothetical protein
LPDTRGVYSGSSGGVFQSKTSNLSSFAGHTAQLRWRFTTDGSFEEGLNPDDVQVTDASTHAACSIRRKDRGGAESLLGISRIVRVRFDSP